MATTILPAYEDMPLVETNVDLIRLTAVHWLRSAQGDADKADEIESANYYQGQADALSSLLRLMTTGDPSDEVTVDTTNAQEGAPHDQHE